jgi:serine/threonine-protein kinase
MPSVYRAGIPPVLEAICRKAMAIDPAERFQTASAMADALDDELADRAAGAGAAGLAAAAAGATVAGVARANPPIPYSPDAYAGAGSGTPPPPPPAVPARAEPEEGGGGPGPWAWVAGLLGLAILAVVGFLAFRLLTGGSTPPPTQVTVPNFVGQTLDQATQLADATGLKLLPTFVKSNDQPEGTITTQDPASDAKVDPGSTIKITVVSGQDLVAVPDVRNMKESDALKAIVTAGLTAGTSTEAFDPAVPAGAVVSTSPPAGTQVARGSTIDYVLSKGPEPTPSPTPTPAPTPPPTPSPTPSPSPTPAPLTVGDYRCQTLDQATADILADGFILGKVTAQPPGYAAVPDSYVFDQLPAPGKKRAPGTAIDLSVYDPASYPFGTCPPPPSP